MQALSVEDIVVLESEEIRLIDIRPPAVFIRGHLKGAQNIPFQKGHKIPEEVTERPAVVIGMAGVIARQAAIAWRDAGHLVLGYLDGPYAQLEAALSPDRIAQAAILPPERMIDWYQERPGLLLDVRLVEDRHRGVIPGSLAIPVPRLPGELEGVARDVPILTYCGGGSKAVEAAARLLSQGFSQVSVILSGGMDDWYRMGHPIEVPHA